MTGTMPLEEFVVTSAERYIELREQFPNDVGLRRDMNRNVLMYLNCQTMTPQERGNYVAMYYKLRGESKDE
jgi:hypothetical protein